jgi:hypothetical protein|tara:strand:+ start:677 stop:907 length:231 start_codon:yes stop_codon:yes gene_type:complete
MNKYAIAFYDDKDNVEMEVIFENTPKDALNKMLTLTSVSKEDIFEIVRVDKTSGSVLETIEINKMELSGNQIVREI